MHKYDGKCDDQQQYKVILESAMLSTPEGLTNSIPIDVGTSENTNKPSVWKYLNPFSELFNVKQKHLSAY